MNTYLAIDNETGGLEGTSLLSTYMCTLDENLNLVSQLDLFLKPNDGIYKVEAQGMSINKIDLIEHDKTALPYSEGGQYAFKFLKDATEDGKIKLVPLGHNVIFDVITFGQLIGSKTQDKFISYRKLDTAVIAQFLKLAGKILTPLAEVWKAFVPTLKL